MSRIVGVTADLVNIARANLALVQIETDDGHVGVGETLLKRHDQTVLSSLREVGGRLIGQDANHIELLAESLYRDAFWVGGALQAAARSAIDIALWDIKGKRLGAPVYELLGGRTRHEIPAYCHTPAGDSPSTFVANLRAARARGFTAAKTTLPVFYGGPGGSGAADYSGLPGRIPARLRESEYLPTRTIDDIAEFFAAARQEIGPHFELMLDCHGRLSPSNAVRLADALEPYRLLFLEEPIPPESPEALAEVRRKSRVPIAAGERLSSIYEVSLFLAAGSVDVLQCDVVTCGGITGLKKIAAMAEAHYVPLAPHNPNGPVATAASAHVLLAIPNGYLLETVGSERDAQIFAQIVDHAPTVIDGVLTPSDAPGLGLSVTRDAATRFPPIRIDAPR